MKISKKSYYGVRAVLALAQEKEPLSIHSLAEREGLPEDYLEKILQDLRRAGIVEAKKGTAGGYALVRQAKDVNVWEILSVLDGPLKTFAPTFKKDKLPASNAGRVAPAGWPCPPTSHCQTNEVWRRLEQQMEKTFSALSIESLTTHKH